MFMDSLRVLIDISPNLGQWDDSAVGYFFKLFYYYFFNPKIKYGQFLPVNLLVQKRGRIIVVLITE